jgi:PTS system nitrogen regulatory IIA component
MAFGTRYFSRNLRRGDMAEDWYTLDELARHLGRDRREVEKLASRGRIPGRRVSGEWQFHQQEVRHWLENELRGYSDQELAVVEESQRSAEVDSAIPVSCLIRPETVRVPLYARTKPSVLENLLEAAGQSGQVWEPAALLEAIQKREQSMSTALECGVAIPHPRNPLPQTLGESVIAYGRTLSGIPFGAPRSQLTDIFFLVLCRDSRMHLQALARIARMLQLEDFLSDLRAAEDSPSSYAVICAADKKLGEEFS